MMLHNRHCEEAKPTKQSIFFWIASLSLAMTLVSCSGESNYKHPTLSNAESMSAATLCYRYAYAKSDENLKNEVEARNLDCAQELESQGPLGNPQMGAQGPGSF